MADLVTSRPSSASRKALHGEELRMLAEPTPSEIASVCDPINLRFIFIRNRGCSDFCTTPSPSQAGSSSSSTDVAVKELEEVRRESGEQNALKRFGGRERLETFVEVWWRSSRLRSVPLAGWPRFFISSHNVRRRQQYRDLKNTARNRSTRFTPNHNCFCNTGSS